MQVGRLHKKGEKYGLLPKTTQKLGIYILGHPKLYGILVKVVRGPQVLEKRRTVSKNEKLKFWIGTKCCHCDGYKASTAQ